jgi:hypothetical protein
VHHRLLRFIAAALFFAAGSWVSFALRVDASPEDVESRCFSGAGGGVSMEVCTPWDD